ncbi:MAG TPA: universal stress protein [Bradyrhizobium sp.]|nr:universal stress protein [Bradyrhizobium sp.]
MLVEAAVTINRRDFDAAIFDLDGVLTDMAGVHAAAWKTVFDAFLQRWAEQHGRAFQPFDIHSDYLRYVDQPQHEWPAWTSEFVKRLACVCPLGHLHVRLVLARGNPAAEIVRLAKKQSTDLVVLVWRGKWEVPHATTLKAILHKARCPIMVLRA